MDTPPRVSRYPFVKSGQRSAEVIAIHHSVTQPRAPLTERSALCDMSYRSIPYASVFLLYLLHSYASGGTIRTGRCPCFNTRSATEGCMSSWNPVRPCVPVTIRSASSSSAALVIVFHQVTFSMGNAVFPGEFFAFKGEIPGVCKAGILHHFFGVPIRLD